MLNNLISTPCFILKYADDSYLIIPSNNADTIQDELDHIAEWADTNNLKLNTSKTKELIIHRPKATYPDPPTLAGVERVHLLTILGIVFQSDLSFREHVKQVDVRKTSTPSEYSERTACRVRTSEVWPTQPSSLDLPMRHRLGGVW